MRARRLLVLVAIGGVFTTAGVAYAAFTAVTSNAGNSISSGTVEISDNDGGGALVALTGATPGSTDTGCIRVTYSGSLSSSVRLYGSVAGGLAPHLILTVTRGIDSAPSYRSCSNFTPDATDYIGAGAGVVWTGLLSAFPTGWAGGIVDPEAWTTSEAHSYRFVVSAVDRNTAAGLTSTFSASWEARSS